MKKILVITMALCVLGAFVAGCTASAEGTATGGETKTETPKDPAAGEETK